MSNLHVPKCTIPLLVKGATQCVTCNMGGNLQTYIYNGGKLNLLVGADNYSGLHVDPKTCNLYEARAAGAVSSAPRKLFVPERGIHHTVWDAWSASLYAAYGNAIVRIRDDEVLVLAGNVTGKGSIDRDGSGTEARFRFISGLASDGAGALYVAQAEGKLRKVQLPTALQCGSGAGAAVPVAGPGGEALVSTLPLEGLRTPIRALVHVPSPTGRPGSLVYGTGTAMYQVQLGRDGHDASPSMLLAGDKNEEGSVDGQGAEARFVDIQDMTVDAAGRIICADAHQNDDDDDDDTDPDASAVRCVAPDGTVTTLVAKVDGHCFKPFILPNGYLMLFDWAKSKLVVFSLGLKPKLLTPTANNNDPQPGSLPADWGALLDQPEATSDLTLVAGGRVFPVHRLVLSIRCEYFRRCLAEGAFAEGSAAQLPLPDANPDALVHVLRFIYTGMIDIPTAHTCSVAELSDRLLLPVLTAAACEEVRAGMAPETAVDRLLWAERCAMRGGGFLQLRADLKTWYVEHYGDVKRKAPDSQRQLAAASPDLMLELLDSALSEERASKRLRL